MSNHSHWPFGQTAKGVAPRHIDAEREREIQREQARIVAEMTHKIRARNDRLIVGGRAHTRKHGLS